MDWRPKCQQSPSVLYPRLCQHVLMGMFVGWAVRGWWLLFIGVSVAILSASLPLPNRPVRLVVLSFGLAIILVQLVMLYRETSRARGSRDLRR